MPETLTRPEDTLTDADRAWVNYTAVGMCPEHSDGEHRFVRDSDDAGAWVACDCGEVPAR